MKRALLLLVLVGCGSGSVQNGGDGGTNMHHPDAAIGGPDASPPCVPACAMDQLCEGGTCVQITGAFQVDVGASPHAIHPEIYGLAFADAPTIAELGVTVNRWGGNGTTLYNWQLDVGNTANDWYFENIPNNVGDPTYGSPAYKSAADQFFMTNHGAGIDTLFVVPTIGWTAKDRVESHPYTCGFPVSIYGPQQSTDPYDSNCGNGMDPGGTAIMGNAANDAIAAPPSFEAQWLAHLTAVYGTSSSGGVRYYSLDNEMMLWDSTHRDVHPNPVTYDEVWQATMNYAPIIRSADPGATILGYGSWGVLDLWDSGVDTKNNNSADQMAHGGQLLAPWYLAQLAAYESAHGTRLVDCLDIHYYPQGGDSLENTASLWDPTYHDPSWIDGWLGEPVRLLPRVSEWIAANYPGTGMCITEYNFNLSDMDNPNAALAEADVLGIFGKYGVRLATYWTTPIDSGGKHAAAWGMQLMRNYDGAGGHFADVSVGAGSSIPGVAIYGATTSAGDAVTVLLINKNDTPAMGGLAITNFTPGATAHIYSFHAGDTAITHGADQPVASNVVNVTIPAKTMIMVIVPK
jgi:hypothetical protein